MAPLLHRVAVELVLKGLGHTEAVETVNLRPPSARLPGDVWLRVGDQSVDPGFAAVLGPFGIFPLRGSADLDLLRLIRELTPNVALASLSSKYASTIYRDPLVYDDAIKLSPTGSYGFAQRAGFTVAWPMPDQDISFVEE